MPPAVLVKPGGGGEERAGEGAGAEKGSTNRRGLRRSAEEALKRAEAGIAEVKSALQPEAPKAPGK